jgi:hypothetical protein
VQATFGTDTLERRPSSGKQLNGLSRWGSDPRIALKPLVPNSQPI